MSFSILNKLMEQMATYRDLVDQAIQRRKKKSESRKSKRLKIDLGRFPFVYDCDEDNYHCITPVAPIEENTDNSLVMGRHLGTHSGKRESDESYKV
ncbi:hypothetical protein Tco_1123266 [Tanacetum coccineum]|uniref:Uncharacterized protein n=1 Tax=Tanacetum coccineum TaxID=301880 RepID=A0ABQ5J2V8_9ASTR